MEKKKKKPIHTHKHNMQFCLVQLKRIVYRNLVINLPSSSTISHYKKPSTIGV